MSMSMVRARLLSRGAALAIGLVLVLGMALGLGLARLIPDAEAHHDPGVIHACTGDRSGALRVVAGPDDCLRGETPISWNAEGSSGPTSVRSAFSETQIVPSGEPAHAEVFCEPDEFVSGGGWTTAPNVSIQLSAPAIDPASGEVRGWGVSVLNHNLFAAGFAAVATCSRY